MIAWRIEKKSRLASAKTGEGARLVGGRWNSPGAAVVYASEHLSLAVLEVLVHAPLPTQRTVTRARAMLTIADHQIERITLTDLPADFGPRTPYTTTQAIGDRWLQEQRRPALLVPSAIVPSEHNLLLNPVHSDFNKCTWDAFDEINLDPRLWVVA